NWIINFFIVEMGNLNYMLAEDGQFIIFCVLKNLINNFIFIHLNIGIKPKAKTIWKIDALRWLQDENLKKWNDIYNMAQLFDDRVAVRFVRKKQLSCAISYIIFHSSLPRHHGFSLLQFSCGLFFSNTAEYE
ncbi:hypothetical protein ACJX0J_030833, partial [Zea mays]